MYPHHLIKLRLRNCGLTADGSVRDPDTSVTGGCRDWYTVLHCSQFLDGRTVLLCTVLTVVVHDRL